jgi:hypothetical protein
MTRPRPYTPEPWADHAVSGETLVTGPTARRVLGPARGGERPWPRDPAWQQAELAVPYPDDDQETLW